MTAKNGYRISRMPAHAPNADTYARIVLCVALRESIQCTFDALFDCLCRLMRIDDRHGRRYTISMLKRAGHYRWRARYRFRWADSAARYATMIFTRPALFEDDAPQRARKCAIDDYYGPKNFHFAIAPHYHSNGEPGAFYAAITRRDGHAA